VQTRGLQAFYSNSPKFQYFIKLMYGLAFVPPEAVEDTFENVVLGYLEDHRQEEGFLDNIKAVDDLVNYYERTYIGAVFGRQRTRRQPLFPVDTWNKYQDVLDGVDITNNRVEGFNSGWTASLSRQPSLYTVLEGFLQKEAWAETILREDAVAVGGNAMNDNRSRRLQAVQRRQDLKALCEAFHTMPLAIYMDSMIKFFVHE
jgi:hypothetical protein